MRVSLGGTLAYLSWEWGTSLSPFLMEVEERDPLNLMVWEVSCLEDFSVKISHGYLPLDKIADPMANFRTGICAGLSPLEAITAPEADLFTFGLDLDSSGLYLCRDSNFVLCSRLWGRLLRFWTVFGRNLNWICVRLPHM